MSKEEADAYKNSFKAHGDHESKGVFLLSTCPICQWRSADDVQQRKDWAKRLRKAISPSFSAHSGNDSFAQIRKVIAELESKP